MLVAFAAGGDSDACAETDSSWPSIGNGHRQRLEDALCRPRRDSD